DKLIPIDEFACAFSLETLISVFSTTDLNVSVYLEYLNKKISGPLCRCSAKSFYFNLLLKSRSRTYGHIVSWSSWLIICPNRFSDENTGSVSSSQPPFVQMPGETFNSTGSPVTSGYYGVRRSFLSDSDFHSSKQFSNDLYPSSVTKSFACESSAGQSHTGLLESYLAEPYGDYRPPALTSTPNALFSTSTLPPLLPAPFPGDPAHFVFTPGIKQACTFQPMFSLEDPVTSINVLDVAKGKL
ncbi:hypothetical protein STEG23_024526, partial [Scotinomys teguina]